MKTLKLAIVSLAMLVLVAAPVHAIGIATNGLSGTLEDAVLFASNSDATLNGGYGLGDIALADGPLLVPLNAAHMDNWWLLGHQGGSIVYSSNVDMSGMDLFDIEPYNDAGYQGFNTIAHLEALAAGTPIPDGWYTFTLFNHASHNAATGSTATLYSFNSPGTPLGQIAINLLSDEIPTISNGNGTGNAIPEPNTLVLLSVCLLASAGMMRRREP